MSDSTHKNRVNCRVCKARYNTTGMESGAPFSCRHCGAIMHVPGKRARSQQAGTELPFGQMAVKLKFITVAQLQATLKKQLALGNSTTRLGDLLLEDGLLTASQVSEILESQGSQITHLVPGYEIVEKLGVGGMGAVYKGLHLASQKTVAMKVMIDKLAKRKDFLTRFHREARVAIAMDHEHIVKGFDEGTAGDMHYFVMEYVHGKSTLRILRKQGAFSELRSMDIARQMTDALCYGYERDILHRDIKPDNIMIDLHGTAKLADYGLVKHLDESEDAGLTIDGQVMGTPNYISPEQARGDKSLDVRSDIYSLGASLFHLLTGRPPFKGASAAVIMGMHVTAPRPHPQEFRPELSDDACAIVLKMLAINREDRYQTPQELRADIERYFKQKPTKAKVATDEHYHTPIPKDSQRLRAVTQSVRDSLDSSSEALTEEGRDLSHSAKILFMVGVGVLLLGLVTAGWFLLRGNSGKGNDLGSNNHVHHKETAGELLRQSEKASRNDQLRLLDKLIKTFPGTLEAEEAKGIQHRLEAWRQADVIADDLLKSALRQTGKKREVILRRLIKKYPDQTATPRARSEIAILEARRKRITREHQRREEAKKRQRETAAKKALFSAQQEDDEGRPSPRETALLAVIRQYSDTASAEQAADELHTLREEQTRIARREKREREYREKIQREKAARKKARELKIVTHKYLTYYAPAMSTMNIPVAKKYAKKLAADKRYPELQQLGRDCLADAEELDKFLPAITAGLLKAGNRPQALLFRGEEEVIARVDSVREQKIHLTVKGSVPSVRQLSDLDADYASEMFKKGFTGEAAVAERILLVYFWARGNTSRAALIFRTIKDDDPRRAHYARLLRWNIDDYLNNAREF